jgi:hypothetical protein
MTDQPPAQPPRQPSGHPAEGIPAAPPTQPMPAAGPAGGPAAATSPGPPTTNVWRQATSTPGGRWAIGIAAGALAVLMLLGVVVAGMVVLRGHDRVAMMGQRQDRYSHDLDGQGRQGNGRGPGAQDGNPQQPGMPGGQGMQGGRGQGLGGLGNLLGGTALHGNVSAKVNGAVQALVFQRGKVTAVSATSLTVKSSDGFVGTYGLTAATSSRRAAPVKGGQAFVLARASDKVAITTIAMPAGTGAAPSS